MPFVAPGSMPDAAAHEGLSAVLDALDDMERWKVFTLLFTLLFRLCLAVLARLSPALI